MMSLFVTHRCQIYLSIQVQHSSYTVTGDGCFKLGKFCGL